MLRLLQDSRVAHSMPQRDGDGDAVLFDRGLCHRPTSSCSTKIKDSPFASCYEFFKGFPHPFWSPIGVSISQREGQRGFKLKDAVEACRHMGKAKPGEGRGCPRSDGEPAAERDRQAAMTPSPGLCSRHWELQEDPDCPWPPHSSGHRCDNRAHGPGCDESVEQGGKTSVRGWGPQGEEQPEQGFEG